jgi:hypothetical protein
MSVLRSAGRRPSAQSAHLRVEEIAEDAVHLGAGEYRAVLEVGSINFALASAAEQEALLASFAAFLNSLTFPIQIVVRVLPLDLERYLGELERRARVELPEALGDLAREHVAFLRRLARNRTLLERRFYVVVPAHSSAEGGRRLWPLARRELSADVAGARRQLTFRVEEVARELGRCGLPTRRLTSSELAELYYACWCPELARVQRIRQEIGEYSALALASTSRRTGQAGSRSDAALAGANGVAIRNRRRSPDGRESGLDSARDDVTAVGRL